MSKKSRLVSINSRKFDGTIHRSWKAQLIEHHNDRLIFVAEFEEEVRHAQLGVIRRGTVSYEYYWLDRWYNVFRFDEPEGGLRNFYCNLSIPPKFENGVLDYVDLDIDILLWEDGTFEILDLEEFEQNKVLYGYPADLILKTNQTLDELQKMIRLHSFPFSSDFRR